MKKSQLLLIACFLGFLLTGVFSGIASASMLQDNQSDVEYQEIHGMVPQVSTGFDATAGIRGTLDIPGEGLLMIPNSTNRTVMAFDPFSGDLVEEFFIPSDPDNLSTPIMMLWNHSQTSFLISDQLRKLVQQYDTEGNFEQTFAPAGGEDQDILHNIRGMYMQPDGTLLVTVAGGSNQNSVAMFDTEGEYLGNFIANNAGGLNGPWNIVYRSDFNDYLISANGSSGIHRYDADGNFIEMFATGISFPQQLVLLDNGNIMVTNFSSPSGVYEFDSEGNQLNYYSVVTGLRGVYELGNGNILVTNGSGVHEINRNNQLVETKATGSARHISHIMPPATGTSFIVTFSVTDDHGNDVDDATITFAGVTYDPGHYVFEDVEPGTHQYMVEHNCHVTAEGSVTVVNSHVLIDAELQGNPGDANGDGNVNVLDVIAMINYYVGVDTDLTCFNNADLNGDGVINILDIIGTVHIFEDDNDEEP